MGDANLDGVDNYTDALRLQADYNHTNANWDQADFNFDGVVNSTDAILMSRNYNALVPAAVEAAAQPTAPPQSPPASPAVPTGDNGDPLIDHVSKRHPRRHGR